MSNGALQVAQPAAITSPVADLSVMEQVIVKGNLADLTPSERVQLYMETCRSLGLNPLTRPFDYIELDSGKRDGEAKKQLTLYAKRDATDQLRRVHGVSTSIVSREVVDGVYIVTARAMTKDGRTDESVGAVALVKEGGEWKTSTNGKSYFKGDGTFAPLSPEARANAMMKAETKAKRRVTMSICGLGWLDETEIDTIPRASAVVVDTETGEIIETPSQPNTPKQAAAMDGEIVDWTEMWKRLRARKIDADTYESVVGRSPQSFESPQAALDALTAAETQGQAAQAGIPGVKGNYDHLGS